LSSGGKELCRLAGVGGCCFPRGSTCYGAPYGHSQFERVDVRCVTRTVLYEAGTPRADVPMSVGFRPTPMGQFDRSGCLQKEFSRSARKHEGSMLQETGRSHLTIIPSARAVRRLECKEYCFIVDCSRRSGPSRYTLSIVLWPCFILVPEGPIMILAHARPIFFPNIDYPSDCGGMAVHPA